MIYNTFFCSDLWAHTYIQIKTKENIRYLVKIIMIHKKCLNSLRLATKYTKKYNRKKGIDWLFICDLGPVSQKFVRTIFALRIR